MSERGRSSGLLGPLAVGMAVCCGMMLAASAAVAVGLLGLIVGGTVGVVLVAAAAVWGWRRYRTVRRTAAPDLTTDSPGGR